MTVMVDPPDAPPIPALQDAMMSNAVVEESADGLAPMEVVSAQSTPETKVESQQLDDPQTFRFTWKIEDFSKLKDRQFSDVFVVGQCKWQLLIELKENNPYLGLYLVVADLATLPPDCTRSALFDLAVVDQKDSNYTKKRVTHQTFSRRTPDWGFPNFMPLSIFRDQIRGYVVSDTSIIEATVRELIDHSTYDSKKETGYVGLKNQGATCYMNSLLQTLYHIPYFRKAVYHMPTTENDMPSGSIPLALQRLFYELQYHASTVATQELTTSFGWGSGDAFLQHDVQELNRVLCEKLENCMKGTVVEGTIQKLFEGHHMNYIECINVDYRSTRKEAFYDLQLVVRGCEDVYASFDKYIEVEKLERDNKYQAERHGLQDARKGVLFLDFPPVLQLHLKRFEYDPIQDVMVKINDHYEFPLQLDLDRDDGKYLSPNADRHVRNLYTLHSVLVHSGGVHGGHYNAFIRPTLSDKWFKFDDERVTIEDAKKALEEQYGGFEELPQATAKVPKNSNAYMLFYIRESDLERIICKVDEQDIAQHVIVRWKKEQEERERKKKEEAEAHLYSTIKVVRDQDLAEQIGRDLFIDLVDFDNVKSYRVPKETPFGNFKEEVAKSLGIRVEFLRFWLWAKRRNNTYCLNRPLSFDEESGTVGLLAKGPHEGNTAELKFFVEVELGKDSCPVSLPEKSEEDMLLFFKLYDPKKEDLRYVGRLSVKATGRPVEILGKLREMAGFCENEEVELYAVDFLEPEGMCDDIDINISFLSHQLKDGDIICYQRATPLEGNEQVHYPDVPAFLQYVLHREVIHFQSLEKPNEDAFSLTLSKLCSYDEVVEKVANHLGLDDPTKIRLTSHNHYSKNPKRQPIKYRGVETLEEMLLHHNQITNTLYYEVLDIPLPELESLKILKFAFRRATKDEAVLYTVRLPKTSTVGDVINDLKTKVELSHPDAELRLLEVYSHRIYKVFQISDKIENINDQYWTLRAEEIPEEEKEIGPNGRLIHVYHFTRDANQSPTTVQNFGEPFFFVIHKGETLAEIKIRMQKKLQTPEEEFAKWKFAFVSLGRPEYLKDTDVLSSRFQRGEVYGSWEQYLGMEHMDNSAPRNAHTSQNKHQYEKPIKIFN